MDEFLNTAEFADQLSEIEREWPKRDVADRWTPLLILDGWTGVSNTFLKAYSRLNPPLTTIEAMFVIHLIQYKWSEDAPFPSLSSIADRMGVSLGAVRGYARSLEQKGYLKREGTTGKPNKYHFDGLFRALESCWQERMKD